MAPTNTLQGKHILFLAPCFHGYETMIIEKLIRKGAKVDFFPERDYSIKFKLINNLSQKLLSRLQAIHYTSIIEKTKNEQFDFLLVIRGYKITNKFLEEFRSRNPQAKKIMYQWDSNATNPFQHVKDAFDRVLSFDYRDCREMSLEYLPLFHTDDVIIRDKKGKYESDFFFMGTYIPERYRAVVEFRQRYQNQYKINSYIYIPATSLMKERLKRTSLSLDLVSTVHMPRATYLEMLNETRVMVDVSNKDQTGLAMRIIEAISMKKKIATNNRYILNEPFYNPDNICVFDANNPQIPDSFVNTPFVGEPHTLSLGQWIDELLMA